MWYNYPGVVFGGNNKFVCGIWRKQRVCLIYEHQIWIMDRKTNITNLLCFVFYVDLINAQQLWTSLFAHLDLYFLY
jgi:hypothetical protein